MNKPYVGSDAQLTRLRAIVATIGAEMSRLRTLIPNGDGATTTASAHAAWDELVALLALGPEPEMQQCPVCGEMIRRAATRCRSCWTRLPSSDDSLTVLEQ